MQIGPSKTFNLFLGSSRKGKFKKRGGRRIKRSRRRAHALKSVREIESSYSAEIVGSNEDLLSQIFSKLKKEKLAPLACVCKNWYRLITGHKYVYKIPPPSHLLIRRYTRRTGPSNHSNVKYITAPLDTTLNRPLTPEIDVNGIQIKQSCNGLLLCPGISAEKGKIPTTASPNVKHYVYNPTTNESRLIPLPLAEVGEIEVTSMNLAFDPSDSPYYKVVALSRVRKQYFSYTRIDIYSSETKQWRISPAELPRNCDHVDFRCGVFLNGAIHWPSHVGETSLYFDLENESFKNMAMPPVQGGWTRRTIRFFGEASGRLLLIDFHEPYTETFDLFQLEDYSRWTVRHHVDLPWWFNADRFHVLSVIRGRVFRGREEEDDTEDLSLVMYLPGRDKAGKGLIIYDLTEYLSIKSKLKKVHSPVLHGWDLRQFEEEGFQVVHPLIRATFAV